MSRGGWMCTAGATRRAGVLVAAVLVLGVAWMHTLAAAPLPNGGHPAEHAASHASSHVGGYASGHVAAAMAVATPPCAADGHDAPCPDAPHGSGHAASMCQSTVPGLTGVHLPSFVPSLPAVPVTAARPWPATVAVEAAGGSGCGPPSLSMLSISRT